MLAAHRDFLKVSVSLVGSRDLCWNQFYDTSTENSPALLSQDISHVPVLISISGEPEVSTKRSSVTKGFVFTSLAKKPKPLRKLLDNIAWHTRKILFLEFICKMLLLSILILCSTIQIISWVTSMITKSVRHYIRQGEFDPEQPVLKLHSLIMFFFPCMGVAQ